MPKQLFQYDLLISCPGDISNDEISAIDDAVNDFNAAYEDVMGIKVRTKHWSKSSYSESGGKPQDLLNKQFVKDCDLTIALFWTRFGTPTDTYGSGTEEEIEIMLESGKQVFVGFCEIPINPSILSSPKNSDEYNRVLTFKEKYKERGIYFSYSSIEDLKKIFYAHLSTHFIIQSKNDNSNEVLMPNLSVKSISNNLLLDIVYTYSFTESLIFESPLNAILGLFTKISAYDVCDEEVMEITNVMKAFNLDKLNELNSSFYPKVEFDKDKQILIETCAKALDIKLHSHFFSLGDLRREALNLNVFGGGKSLKGTDNEKSKYEDLYNLYDYIEYYIGITKFEKLYENLLCISLAISNNGTTFDEDIEISLLFPKDMLIKHRELPVIDSYSLDKIYEKHYLEDFFGIPRTSRYNGYDSSIKPLPVVNNYKPTPSMHELLNNNSDPTEDFYERMDDVFTYDYFEENDSVILKLHLDYIKHNSTIAFPSVIFVRHSDSDISYVLKSKHCKDEIHGRIIGKITEINHAESLKADAMTSSLNSM